MNAFEDLSLFFRDFSVPATFGAEVANVLIDLPNTYDFSGQVVVSDTKITYPNTVLTGMKAGSTITVESKSYKVKSIVAKDDGKLIEAFLVAL